LLAQYFAFFTPNMVRFVLPVACLCAVLVTIAVLSRNGEIVAMKAGGLSLGRVSRPLLGTTLVICLLFFLSQEYVFPVTNRQAESIRDRIAGRPAVSEEEAGRRWVFGSARRLYGYRVYSPTRHRLDGVSVLDLSPSRLSLQRWIEAERARVVKGQWIFQEGWIREFHEGSETYEEFRQLVLPLQEGPELFGRREQLLTGTSRLPDQTSFLDLWNQIRDLRAAGYYVDELSVGLYEKIAYPLTPLVMVLLGLPFAFRIGPRGSLYGIGVALILVITYWAVFALFQSLGMDGRLNPLLAAGAPNVLFALAGAYLFLTLRS
jgi:LPS export ABC transporter permease LptG